MGNDAACRACSCQAAGHRGELGWGTMPLVALVAVRQQATEASSDGERCRLSALVAVRQQATEASSDGERCRLSALVAVRQQATEASSDGERCRLSRL